MGYASVVNVGATYRPSENVLVFDLATFSTSSEVYVIAKSLLRLTDVYQNSGFRISFTIGSSSAGAGHNYGQIYHNGVAVGTERYQGIGSSTWSEDLYFTELHVGDTIELWCHTDAGHTGYCSDFYLKGIESDWLVQ